MTPEPDFDELYESLTDVADMTECDDCGTNILDPRETDFIISFGAGSISFVSKMYQTVSSPRTAIKTLQRAYSGEKLEQLENLEEYRTEIDTVIDTEEGVTRCAECAAKNSGMSSGS